MRAEIGYYRIEAGSARFDTVVTDLSSHSQPHYISVSVIYIENRREIFDRVCII